MTLDSTGQDADAAVSVTAAVEGEQPSFVYVDCGAWMGDGRNAPLQRSFVLQCGSVVALCEFRPGSVWRPKEATGDPANAAVDRVLKALAGPQAMDVVVRARVATPWSGSAAANAVNVFLPDMHLPLITPMPDVDRDLVPDPAQATCWCHGPIFARIDGKVGQLSEYRAIGTYLSRNPNDWFQLLANTYRAAADDLIRFLDRLSRLGLNTRYHVIHLGGVFDVWAGYQCVFHARGLAAYMRPRIVATAGEESFRSKWVEQTVDGRIKEAVTRLFRVQSDRRTVLSAPLTHARPELGLAEPPAESGPRSLRTDEFFAENRPEPVDYCEDRPPHAVLGIAEQRAQLIPWTRRPHEAWRERYVHAAGIAWRRARFPLYVMAHSHVPCLMPVVVRAV